MSHATRGARHYRYYVEARSQEDTSTPFEPIRLPAVEIETAAVQALRLMLDDHRQVLHQLDDLDPAQKANALKRSPQLASGLAASTKGTAEIFRSLVTKVTYRRDRLALHISRTGFRSGLGVERPAVSWPDNADDPTESFVVSAPLLYRRRGVQAKLVIDDGKLDRRPDLSLQQAAAWGRQAATGNAYGRRLQRRTAGRACRTRAGSWPALAEAKLSWNRKLSWAFFDRCEARQPDAATRETRRFFWFLALANETAHEFMFRPAHITQQRILEEVPCQNIKMKLSRKFYRRSTSKRW